MTRNCHELVVSEIKSITASYSSEMKVITSLEFIQDSGNKTFGKKSGSAEKWTFRADESFIGFYGRVNKNGISQLGVIQKKEVCDDHQEILNSYNWV